MEESVADNVGGDVFIATQNNCVMIAEIAGRS